MALLLSLFIVCDNYILVLVLVLVLFFDGTIPVFFSNEISSLRVYHLRLSFCFKNHISTAYIEDLHTVVASQYIYWKDWLILQKIFRTGHHRSWKPCHACQQFPHFRNNDISVVLFPWQLSCLVLSCLAVLSCLRHGIGCFAEQLESTGWLTDD